MEDELETILKLLEDVEDQKDPAVLNQRLCDMFGFGVQTVVMENKEPTKIFTFVIQRHGVDPHEWSDDNVIHALDITLLEDHHLWIRKSNLSPAMLRIQAQSTPPCDLSLAAVDLLFFHFRNNDWDCNLHVVPDLTETTIVLGYIFLTCRCTAQAGTLFCGIVEDLWKSSVREFIMFKIHILKRKKKQLKKNMEESAQRADFLRKRADSIQELVILRQCLGQFGLQDVAGELMRFKVATD